MLHEPPDAVDWTLSDIACDFAESIGIILDDWQRWLVRWTFVRRPDLLWAARDVGGEVPRQNGKNIWLEIVELAGLFLFGDRLITHSAHRADVSMEHFLSLKGHIEASDDLMDAMPKTGNRGFTASHGQESIELASGARLLFKARASTSGRGPRPQKVIFDEALVLGATQMGSMVPSISAQRNPQVIFASSAPLPGSTVLHGLRYRAEHPEFGDRLFYAAGNNPQGIDETDQEAMYRVNPSLGLGRMTEESLLANRRLLVASPGEYAREHLGVPQMPADETEIAPAKLPPLAWAGCRTDTEIDGPCVLAYEVTEDGAWTTIALAAGDQQRPFVQELAHRPGTTWLPDEWVRIVTALKPTRLACVGHGLAGAQMGSVMLAMAKAGIDTRLEPVAMTDYRLACQTFYTDVDEGRLSWFRGSEWLDMAARDACERKYGSAWAWAPRTEPISPLGAATVARALLPVAVEVSKSTQFYSF